MSLSITLGQLAEQVGAKLRLVNGDTEDTMIDSIGTLAKATAGQLSFLSNSKYRTLLTETKAQAVVLHPDEVEHCPCTALVMTNPYVGFALAAQALDTTPDSAHELAPSASIHPSVQLGKNVRVGANSVIEKNVVIGDNVQIGAGCFVGEGAKIGQNTKLWANVVVYHKVVIGTDCLIQASTVLGSDGFGYANHQGKWLKIPQLGSVVLGNRVEIGSSTTIDRGALDDTILADGVIIDNQCQIAHNVEIGENTAMAGCSVIAGSTVIGKNCSIAGLVGINGHIKICDGVIITGMSMVTKAITEPGVYSSGMPAEPNKIWRKNAVAVRHLADMNMRLKTIEKSLDQS